MARRPSLPKMNESKFVLVLVVVLNRWENSGQNRAVKLCATLLDSCMVSPSNFDHEKLECAACQYRVRESAQA